jgi:hypothetical protein
VNDTPDLRSDTTHERGTDQRSRKDRRGREPSDLVLIEGQGTREHQTMETGRRACGGGKHLRVAEHESKRHGTIFFAQQRRLVTDRQDARQLGGAKRHQVGLPRRSGVVPSAQDEVNEISRICMAGDGLRQLRSLIIDPRTVVGLDR